MKLVWLQGDEGTVSYASKYLVVFLVDSNVTRALSTLRTTSFIVNDNHTIQYAITGPSVYWRSLC